jgi:4-hydroxy-tetrahydrodipicolinate synthase
MTAPKLDERAKGVYIISATPFADDGAVDFASLDRLTDWYLGHGVDGITILGILGEAPKLAPDESLAIVRRVVARAGAKPVIVGVSHAGMANLAALAGEAMAAGAAGVMVAPVPGLKGDDGLFGYFEQVFRALDPATPVVYQDYPQTTGVFTSVACFERMVDAFPRLVVLKHEDWPGLNKITRLRANAAKAGKRRVSILVGNGGIHLPQELARGADGANTGVAYPEMLVEVCRRFFAGDREGAEDLYDLYLPLVRHELQPGLGLAIRKEILRRRGAIASARLRAPGPSLSAEDRAELDHLMRRLERKLAERDRPARAA